MSFHWATADPSDRPAIVVASYHAFSPGRTLGLNPIPAPLLRLGRSTRCPFSVDRSYRPRLICSTSSRRSLTASSDPARRPLMVSLPTVQDVQAREEWVSTPHRPSTRSHSGARHGG